VIELRREPGGSAFDSAARVAISATVMVGVLVAWAPAIPITLRSATLLLGLLSWTTAVAFCGVRAIQAAWYRPMEWRELSLTVLGAIGIGNAALSAAQLEIIRIVYGRPALVWNVDWRYAWNHAQAIARFGGVNNALDYSAVPVDYHVGPAWLGAATDRLLGGGMTEVLFGLVPLLCVLSAAVALLLLLSLSGIPRRVAAAAVGIAFCLPVGFYLSRFPRGYPRILLNADVWFFASGLMLNSFLAVAVGLGTLVLLFDRRPQVGGMILGAVGLGSLVEIKPPFFVGLGAVAGAVGLGRFLGLTPFAPRSGTVLVASIGALALAVFSKSALPGTPMRFFSMPVWAPGSTGYSLGVARIDLLIAPSLLAILAFVWLWRVSPPKIHRLARLRELLAATVFALVLLSATFTVVRFPAHADIVTRANAQGLTYIVAATQHNLAAQVLLPLRLLLAVCAVAGLAVLLAYDRMPVRGIPIMLVAGLIVASPFPLIGRNFMQPLRAYEAAEDMDLVTVLRYVPRNGDLLIASDLADSAEDYARPLRATLLSAYGGHVFYVANLAYWHFRRADAAQRLENLRAFFGSAWSHWHDTWLARAHISHVLVSDRCFPRWWEQKDTGLRVVGRKGRWTLLESRGLTARDSSLPPSWEIMKPRYGLSPCL
jgi:hypothetical protein